MPETIQQKKRFTAADLKRVGEFMRIELERRKEKRRHRDALWREIDRQLRMEPRPRDVRSGTADDWYPDQELPLQFNALEVIAADARRLKFPRGTEWFGVSSEVSDEYIKRWQDRRERAALISGMGFSAEPDSPFKQLAQQTELDQETADTLVKAAMDHYHRMYDFREQIDLFDAEQIKYGTGVVRVLPAKMSKLSIDFRGQKGGLEGPAVIPCSIKSVYLDDSPLITHEGVMISPLTMRAASQGLDSLIMAAKRGGPDRGWLPNQIRGLKPLNNRRHVDIIEGEGDFIIPKSQGSIFLPNFLITIAIGQGDARVVRMRENPVPFRSYVVGHYMRDDPRSPYGSSPLMKGQPIQEAAVSVFNDMIAAARYNAKPAMAYDRHDPNFAAQGGPDLFPGALIPSDAPNAVEPIKIGDVAALTNSYLALLKHYEDLTGVNDARRGAPVKSHTTTGGIELEAQRGIARTDDFVSANEQGPIRTILYMEYDIIKKSMTGTQPVAVGSGGIEGWVNIAAQDLPKNVVFNVHGSSGALNEREMSANFLNASNFVVQLAAQAQQLQKPFEVNFEEIATEAYKRAGTQNASRFIGSTQANAPAPAGGPGVPGANGADAAAEDLLTSLVPQPTV